MRRTIRAGSARLRFGVQAVLLVVLVLLVPHVARGALGGLTPVVSAEAWFPATVPMPDTVSEARFRGQDIRYLRTLHGLAEVVVTLAETGGNLIVGERYVQDASEAEYTEYLEGASSPTSSNTVPLDTREIQASHEPGRPPREVQYRTQAIRRWFATPKQMRGEWAMDWTRDHRPLTWTMQRARGGTQEWTINPAVEEEHSAGMYSASWPHYRKTTVPYLLEVLWLDVDLLSRALAQLNALGPPDRIHEEQEKGKPRFRMVWNEGGPDEIGVIVAHRPVPLLQEWYTRTVTDIFAHCEEAYAAEKQVWWERGEPIPKENEAWYIETLARWKGKPRELSEARVVFDGWHRTQGERWVPERVDKYNTLHQVSEEGKILGSGHDWFYREIHESHQWIRWVVPPSRNMPATAVVDPPGYEGYEEHQWVDLALPFAASAREKLTSPLRLELELLPSADHLNRDVWRVAEADPVALGVWPIVPGDLILGYTHSRQQALRLSQATDGTDAREFLRGLADALDKTQPGECATIRLARGLTLLDIVCWVPESERAEDLRALQDAMLKSHEYPPLPYEDAVAFAEAVLAATDDLVRGAAE